MNLLFYVITIEALFVVFVMSGLLASLAGNIIISFGISFLGLFLAFFTSERFITDSITMFAWIDGTGVTILKEWFNFFFTI